MTALPMTLKERQAKRAALAAAVMADALEKANRVSRSMKCSGIGFGGIPHHACEPDVGCKNDGTGCLCECHDPSGKS